MLSSVIVKVVGSDGGGIGNGMVATIFQVRCMLVMTCASHSLLQSSNLGFLGKVDWCLGWSWSIGGRGFGIGGSGASLSSHCSWSRWENWMENQQQLDEVLQLQVNRLGVNHQGQRTNQCDEALLWVGRFDSFCNMLDYIQNIMIKCSWIRSNYCQAKMIRKMSV